MCKAEPEKKTKLRSWSNTREVNPLNQQHLREDELGGVGVRFVQQLVKNSCNHSSASPPQVGAAS